MNRSNPAQSQWLKSCTPEEAKAFLAAGEAEALQVFNADTNTIEFVPSLRGIRVGGATYPDAEAAAAAAKSYQDALLAQNLPQVDEVALGIDGHSLQLNEFAEENALRVEQIIHIGLSLGSSDSMAPVLKDFVRDCMDDSLIDHLSPRMPGLQALKKVPNNKDMPGEFADIVAASCLYGYLVHVATPVMSHVLDADGKPKTSNYSWGVYVTEWFYAESIPDALSQAASWVQTQRRAEVAEAAEESSASA